MMQTSCRSSPPNGLVEYPKNLVLITCSAGMIRCSGRTQLNSSSEHQSAAIGLTSHKRTKWQKN
eukprot:scaffold4385_cov162-Skeletonema_menzelii.AAC.4